MKAAQRFCGNLRKRMAINNIGVKLVTHLNERKEVKFIPWTNTGASNDRNTKKGSSAPMNTSSEKLGADEKLDPSLSPSDNEINGSNKASKKKKRFGDKSTMERMWKDWEMLDFDELLQSDLLSSSSPSISQFAENSSMPHPVASCVCSYHSFASTDGSNGPGTTSIGAGPRGFSFPVRALKEDLGWLLERQSRMEEWLAWLDTIVIRKWLSPLGEGILGSNSAAGGRTGGKARLSFVLEDKTLPSLSASEQRAARGRQLCRLHQFRLRWSFLLSQILTELTLAGADTVDIFRLLFHWLEGILFYHLDQISTAREELADELDLAASLFAEVSSPLPSRILNMDGGGSSSPALGKRIASSPQPQFVSLHQSPLPPPEISLPQQPQQQQQHQQQQSPLQPQSSLLPPLQFNFRCQKAPATQSVVKPVPRIQPKPVMTPMPQPQLQPSLSQPQFAQQAQQPQFLQLASGQQQQQGVVFQVMQPPFLPLPAGQMLQLQPFMIQSTQIQSAAEASLHQPQPQPQPQQLQPAQLGQAMYYYNPLGTTATATDTSEGIKAKTPAYLVPTANPSAFKLVPATGF